MPSEKQPVSPSRLVFAARVRQERLSRSRTQEDPGERADLSWNYIARVGHGTRNISVDDMDATAQGLGVRLLEEKLGERR